MTASVSGSSTSRWALPLLLSSSRFADNDGPHPLDRIRMQKAIFLLTQRGSPRWRNSYDYTPYNWGPYCRELTNDLAVLKEAGVLHESGPKAGRYGSYSLTPQGEASADTFVLSLSDPEISFIGEVRKYVTSKDFNSLLREVYEAYPDFASNSLWSGR